MLAAEMASTTAKPSMIFARNLKEGSLDEIDCSQPRLDSPTWTPVFIPSTIGLRKPGFRIPLFQYLGENG